MYQPLPNITEDLETLQARLRSERDPPLKPRLQLLVLLQAGHVTTRRHAAAQLAVHRNTVTTWVQAYRLGGLGGLLTAKAPGAPTGPKRLPAAVFAQLQARLATPPGFTSDLEVQRWLHDEFGLTLPYKTVHGIGRYQLKAKLKRPRPSHAENTPRQWRPFSNRSRVASVPS